MLKLLYKYSEILKNQLEYQSGGVISQNDIDKLKNKLNTNMDQTLYTHLQNILYPKDYKKENLAEKITKATNSLDPTTQIVNNIPSYIVSTVDNEINRFLNALSTSTQISATDIDKFNQIQKAVLGQNDYSQIKQNEIDKLRKAIENVRISMNGLSDKLNPNMDNSVGVLKDDDNMFLNKAAYVLTTITKEDNKPVALQELTKGIIPVEHSFSAIEIEPISAILNTHLTSLDNLIKENNSDNNNNNDQINKTVKEIENISKKIQDFNTKLKKDTNELIEYYQKIKLYMEDISFETDTYKENYTKNKDKFDPKGEILKFVIPTDIFFSFLGKTEIVTKNYDDTTTPESEFKQNIQLYLDTEKFKKLKSHQKNKIYDDIIYFYNKNINLFTKDENKLVLNGDKKDNYTNNKGDPVLPPFYYDGKMIYDIRNDVIEIDSSKVHIEMLKTLVENEKFNNLIETKKKTEGKMDDSRIKDPIIEIQHFFEKMNEWKKTDIVQQGGVINANNLIQTKNEMNKLVDILRDSQKEYNIWVKRVNKLQIYYTLHNYYLLTMVTTTFLGKNYSIYKFINKGLVNYYKMLIDEIVDMFRSSTFIPNPKTDAVKHLKHLHFVTILKVQSFLHHLYNKLDPKDMIDIYRCTTPKYKFYFLLFNHFVEIMEEFKQQLTSPISIYARINDIKPEQEDNKQEDLVRIYKNNSKKLIIDKTRCNKFQNKNPPQDIIFTEIYPSDDNFKDNATISQYLSLHAQLSRKKPIALMTYGYSGTGKTYTLFGKDKTQGLLQSTLERISGLKSIYFRVFEIYGRSMPYSYCWNNIQYVDQKIVYYILDIKDNILEIIPNGEHATKDKTEFENYLQTNDFTSKETTYIPITADKIRSVFQNFTTLTEEIDHRRKTATPPRITATPNNPESSRSILIYEFVLIIDDNKVCFLIVDLPGKEDIIRSYVDDYLKENELTKILYSKKTTGLNDYDAAKLYIEDYIQTNKEGIEEIKQNLQKQKLMMLLTSIAVNPIGLAFMYGHTIYNMCKDFVTEYIVPNENAMCNNVSNWDLKTSCNEKHVKDIVMTKSYTITACNIILDLIQHKKYDYLYEAFKHIVNLEINNKLNTQNIKPLKKPQETGKKQNTQIFNEIPEWIRNFKGGLYNEKIDKYKLTQEILEKLLHYTYINTPWEGVYINENIMSLINDLSRRAKENNKEMNETKIEIQNSIETDKLLENMNKYVSTSADPAFGTTAKGTTEHNKIAEKYINGFTKGQTAGIEKTSVEGFYKWYSSFYQGGTPGIIPFFQYLDPLQIEKVNTKNKEKARYDPNKIYNAIKPVITQVLDAYLTPEKDENIEKKITNYKLNQNDIDILNEYIKYTADVEKNKILKTMKTANEKQNLITKIMDQKNTDIDNINKYTGSLLTSIENEQWKNVILLNNGLVKKFTRKGMKSITDFKVFYLFSNNTKNVTDIKCDKQIDLLVDSANFIKNIVLQKE